MSPVSLIGTRHDERMACTPPTHVLATYNPWSRATWCVCGKARVPDDAWLRHTLWKERFIYDGVGQGAKVIGYDRYRIATCLCHRNGTVELANPEAPP